MDQPQPLDDYSDLPNFGALGYSDFGALIETMIQHMFIGKGYVTPEDWASVDIKSIQIKCGIIKPNDPPKNASLLQQETHQPTSSMAIDCLMQYISSSLEEFLHYENRRYFHYYLYIAIPLIVLAIIFNSVAITSVSRVKQKYLRHYVLISLSISDVILTVALLLKRCGDPNVLGIQSKTDYNDMAPPIGSEGNESSTTIGYNSSPSSPIASFFEDVFLRNHVTGAWQTGYIMSALGLLCLGVDNVLAITAAFFYERLTVRSRWIKCFIVALWLMVMVIVMLLHVLNLSDSFFVQMTVCVIMLILFVSILASYVFTCTQAHLHHMRLAEQTGMGMRYEQAKRLSSGISNNTSRKASSGFDMITQTRFRGFLTTGLLVLACLLCWSPLVGYLFTSEDTLSSSHSFFSRYLCFAMAVLHLNSVIDPVIYCLRMPDIRKSLFTLLGCRQRTNNFAPTNFVPRAPPPTPITPMSRIFTSQFYYTNRQDNQQFTLILEPLEPIDETSDNATDNNNEQTVPIINNNATGDENNHAMGVIKPDNTTIFCNNCKSEEMNGTISNIDDTRNGQITLDQITEI